MVFHDKIIKSLIYRRMRLYPDIGAYSLIGACAYMRISTVYGYINVSHNHYIEKYFPGL